MYWTLELASYLSDAPWPANKPIKKVSKEAFFWFKFTEVPQIEIKTDHEFHKQYYQSLCW